MMFLSGKEPPIVLKIGGSLIVPNGGIDYSFLKKLNKFVREQVKKGRRFFLVTGGGKTSRHYRDAGKAVIGDLSDEDLDWLGIHATRLNGHLLRTIFQDIAHPRIIENYDKKLSNWKEPVVIGTGWKPGWSTNYTTVLIARDYGANLILNLSNIDWVYDKDPNKYKDAKPLKKITWKRMEKLVGTKWIPGMNAPFDPIASQLAKKLELTVIIASGKAFKNLENILEGKKFKGTVIMPYKIDKTFYDKEYYSTKKGEYIFGFSESIIGRNIQRLVNLYRAWLIKIFLKPKNCLDIGCGPGYLVKYLRKLGIDAYGLEISKHAVELVDDEVKPFIKQGDIAKVPFKDNDFDLVVSYDLLEHLDQQEIYKGVTESIRVSRKYILHKIYTLENRWISLIHNKDRSHLSVFSKNFWQNVFISLPNVRLLKSNFFRLPSLFESVFLMKKKP